MSKLTELFGNDSVAVFGLWPSIPGIISSVVERNTYSGVCVCLQMVVLRGSKGLNADLKLPALAGLISGLESPKRNSGVRPARLPIRLSEWSLVPPASPLSPVSYNEH